MVSMCASEGDSWIHTVELVVYRQDMISFWLEKPGHTHTHTHIHTLYMHACMHKHTKISDPCTH